MPNEKDENSNKDQTQEKISEAEILLSRIVDQQATAQDQLRFEQLAIDDPSLWRTLAQQQQEMAALSDTVIEQLVAADLVELPVNRASITPVKPFAFIGWAAAILIAAVWIMLPAKESSQQPLSLTAGQHREEYEKADYVNGAFDPVLLDTEVMEDGRLKLYYMRRHEEWVITNRPLDEIIDGGDKFIVMPEVLRKETTQPSPVNDQ